MANNFSAPKSRSLPTPTNVQDLSSTLTAWKSQLAPLVKNAAPVSTPVNFRVTSARGGLQLSWSPVAGADGYEILKSMNGSFTDDLVVIPISGANNSSYFDSLGGSSQSSNYRVRTTSGTSNNPQSQRGPESGVVSHTSLDSADTKSATTTVLDSYTSDKTRAGARLGNYGAIQTSDAGNVASGSANSLASTASSVASPAASAGVGITFDKIATGANTAATMTVGQNASIVPDVNIPGIISATHVQGNLVSAATPSDGSVLAYSSIDSQYDLPTNIFVNPGGTGSVLPATGNATQSLGSASAPWNAVLGTVGVGNLGNVIVVDGTKYAKTVAGIQAAVVALGVNPGAIWLMPGTYTDDGTTTITVANDRQHIRGWGKHSVIIQAASGRNAPLFLFTKASQPNLLFQTSIGGFSLYGAGTNKKIGVQFIHCSEFHVYDMAWFGWTGSSSVGIDFQGKELGTLSRLSVQADHPVEINVNPQDPNITFDAMHFEDCYLLPSSAQYGVTVATNCKITRWTWDGQGIVAGGAGVITWHETTASTGVPSSEIVFVNVAHEQGTTATAYSFDFQRDAGTDTLQGLTLIGCRAAIEENGFRLQNTINATLIAPRHPHAGGTALNVDSTNNDTVVRNPFFQSGSSAIFAATQNLAVEYLSSSSVFRTNNTGTTVYHDVGTLQVREGNATDAGTIKAKNGNIDVLTLTNAGVCAFVPVGAAFRTNNVTSSFFLDFGDVQTRAGDSNNGGSWKFTGTVGFNNTAPISRPTVTGAKGGNVALANLLTALANYGLIVDSST